ncbi:MAG: glycosyltransferase family 4 protein [Hominimerdicola sp.]
MRKKHILIYAHYYHPDVASTGQLLKELAEGMLDTFDITVICVVPSYAGTVEERYKDKKYYYENINGVNVVRVRVPQFDKTAKMSRVKNILAYFFRAMWSTFKVKDVDYVYSISQPPVLGGLLGVWGKWTRHAKYIYNIQDFNPEQIMATGYSKNKFVLDVMLALDKFSCRRANKLIIVGRDMIETLEKRFKKNKMPEYVFINNWIDEKEIYPLDHTEPHVAEFREKYGLTGKYVFMYSGNIGLYYDLENIIKTIESFPSGTCTPDGREVVFAFVGAGSKKEEIEEYVNKHNMTNVIFIPYQDKSDLNYSLNAADVHWCISAKGIKGVSVPSKLYGELATAKPVICVLEKGAEASIIVEETNCGYISAPGDYEHLKTHINWFIKHAGEPVLEEMGQRGRDYLVKNLTKEVSVEKYIDTIENC